MKSRSTILIVDDDPDIRAMLTLVLEFEGFRVVTAVDRVDALMQLQRERPAVIVLDMMMPRMTGLEFRQEQVRHAEYAHIPAVYMSAAPEAYSSMFTAVRAHVFVSHSTSMNWLRPLPNCVAPRLRRRSSYESCLRS